jgi:gliding motility-associated protein GldM
MGHGKETPRQKMIGMMYLVLTAMLALNVQKEVLNAFVNVDEGLTKTTENFRDKNEIMYGAFEKANAENPVKAGKYLETANEIKKRSKELVDYIQSLKIEIIKTADGDKSPSLEEGGKINPMAINSKDNMDKPAQIMVGSNNNGKGQDVKKKINELREFFLSQLDPKAESVKSSIEKNLATNNPPIGLDGASHSWESENFEHMPLIAVITVMSGIQANIRNAESDILRYLYTRIDEGSFKFNKLEAVVIPNSNYILKGNEYSARVFIAASDSTQSPDIYVGATESVKLSDGSSQYQMKGSGLQLKVEKGQGIYTVRGNTLGTTKWGGLIKLKSPNGGPDITRPFQAEFQVSEPSAVISPTKMNVFYIGIPGGNPVDISVPGVPSNKITASINNGSITSSANGSWAVNPERQGPASITVTAEIDGKKVVIGKKDFRVKPVPDPVAKMSSSKGGGLSKEVMLAAPFILADMENFDFDLKWKVVSFKMEITVGGYNRESISRSSRLTNEQTASISSLQRGQRVTFSEIKAQYGNQVRDLAPITFTLK